MTLNHAFEWAHEKVHHLGKAADYFPGSTGCSKRLTNMAARSLDHEAYFLWVG